MKVPSIQASTAVPTSAPLPREEKTQPKIFKIKSLHFLLLSLLMLLMALPAKAFSPQLDGTMMPYDFALTDSTVPWGSDLKPVFINYVARHGARFLSSEKKIDDLRKDLLKAKSRGTLTSKGERFLALINKVDSVTAGNWGALNATGIMEEQRLGKEMAATCPQLLEEGRIEAIATYVPRVVMTMYELCHELARYSSHLEIYTSEGRQFSPMLRYFTTDKAYVEYIDNGPWHFAFDNFMRNTLPDRPAVALINGVTDSRKLQKMSLDAYGVLQSLRAAGIKADPSEWFTAEEYLQCWEVANLKHYYQRSASAFSSLPATCAIPLLEDIIVKTETALKATDNLKAFLRFGHAETVIPLFALMRLPGCYEPLCNPDDVSKKWKDYEVSPLGANLMIVILKDNSGKAFAAMRLNGRWVETDGSKVTEWEKLKTIWQSYMN